MRICEMSDIDVMRLDQSVTRLEQDRYGFRYVAAQLAQSIQAIGREGSAVIGIEGVWGSGKTSLLNLLHTELDKQKEDNTFVLSISPWLDGSGTSLVESLLIPVAGIIAAEEERLLSPEDRESLEKKKVLTRTARTLMEYTRATARHLAPLAQTAAMIPGIPDASGALDALSESQWLKEKEKTATEMRTEIAEKIVGMDLSFIILLDDLDRLEPAQAVEVVRLVKSVADFPRFRYILCYDKSVLALAIKKGLGVEDGELYLQKIVQISFSLPRPESFDLRREFFSGVVGLYETVNGELPDEEFINDLNRVTDIYGAALKTPREVHLSLNNLWFRYSGIRDYVYLPDLSFLQLIRTTNPGLYDWIEEYLTERAIVESGDGSVSEEEQKLLTQNLVECLSRFRASEAKSVSSLKNWVPGISGYQANIQKLFAQTSDEDKALMTANRRLGSTAYWRYYFAFSSPQNVLPPAYFDELFRKSSNPEEYPAMARELLARINSNGVSSRTWFEHILSQLTRPMINERAAFECHGLLTFFFNAGDEIYERYRQRNRWFSRYDLDVNSVADRLLKRMLDNDRTKTMEILLSLTMKGTAWVWIANYIRDLLWQNGLAGDRAEPENERVLNDGELNCIRQHFCERLNKGELKSLLVQDGDLGGFVWAWQDIAGPEYVISWITQHIDSDKVFLMLLLSLRSHIISSATGHYLTLKIRDIAHLFGGEEMLLERLERIESEDNFPDQVKDVRAAIALSKSF
ncbi:NTPase [Salmonella enterica]|nr:NTPase [Salmonella enterica]EBQ9805461.1 NTPase [Salmonella enterica subsp. enterica serovar Rissen]EEF0679064.1 NTPase [Salmonella enterica subsp. enterica serovar Menston]EAW5616438.1 NTPase [Salmonella enterica]EAZ5195591.1 NTPase [Salmonella enterica]